MKIVVEPYCTERAQDWSAVLAAGKNGLFLFERGFVEYHGDRFVEASLIAYVDGKPVALMPAAIDEESREVVSHPGLTFGGVVLRRNVRSGQTIAVIEAMLTTLAEMKVRSVLIKTVPAVFATYPSGELEYALWRLGFRLVQRDISSVLPLTGALLPFNKSKKQSVAKANKAGLSVGSASLATYYPLLERVLHEHHGTAPTHTLAELDLLQTRFPNNIFVRAAMGGDELLAGALMFRYGDVWHTQYLANAERGRELGALDQVIEALKVEAQAAGARYLSFGKSTEGAGDVINQGLLWQKESYGARSITHDYYRLELS